MPNMQSSSYRLGYRSDIEGLRAIAILLVVAAHAKVSWLAGGFVGVDVFFVLSGYLITGLLIQEISLTGNLKFADFYARRLRRLMPALLLMLLCVCLLGWLLLIPLAQFEQAKAAGGAAIWLSNFYFAFSNLGYFSPDAKTNLFLHTWSLGVEEQFYVIWPLLMVLVTGAWQGAGKPPQPRRLKFVMPVIFFLSLFLCIWWSYRSPHLAFYMMPSRAWQFALGALIFVYFGAPRAAGVENSHSNTHLIRLMGWLGLASIISAALLINDDTIYPGVWALLPSFGAAAVIAAGARSPRSGVGRVLSIYPMQGIGRISYAWYLWHWPVLLLGATVLNMDSALNRSGLVVLSMAVAIVSYRYLEAPVRRMKQLIVKPRIAVAAGLTLMILGGVMTVHWRNSSLRAMQAPDQVRFLQAEWDAPIIYNMGCDDWYFSSSVNICAFGQTKDARHTAVIMGDSVGLQWFPAIQEVFSRKGWRLLVITKSSCPMLDQPLFYQRIGRVYTECSIWRKRATGILEKMKPDIVILGSTYTYKFTKDQWITGTRNLLSQISPFVKHVYLLRSTPTIPFDGPTCLAPRSWLYRLLAAKNRCVAPAHNTRFDDVYAWRKSAASQFSNVTSVDMTDAICPGGECQAQKNGVIVFRDSRHMTATFTRSLGNQLAEQLKIGGDD